MAPCASTARSGRFRQIHFQDRHIEGIGNLAVFLVLEEDADKLAIDVHFHGIRLLGPFDNGDGVETEQVAEILLQAPDFAAGQGRFLINGRGSSRMPGHQGQEAIRNRGPALRRAGRACLEVCCQSQPRGALGRAPLRRSSLSQVHWTCSPASRDAPHPVLSGNSSMKWFICCDGFSPQSQLTSLAGTPTAVQPGGTGLSTTEPAPTRLYSPISMLPRILAPSDKSTPRRILG